MPSCAANLRRPAPCEIKNATGSETGLACLAPSGASPLVPVGAAPPIDRPGPLIPAAKCAHSPSTVGSDAGHKTFGVAAVQHFFERSSDRDVHHGGGAVSAMVTMEMRKAETLANAVICGIPWGLVGVCIG